MDDEFLSVDEQVIKKYEQDEQMMIQLFAQWCVNHSLDPQKLYKKAYPDQQKNTALQRVVDEMNDSERIDIDNETMLDVLQLFGNFDLAFIVSDEIARLSKQS